MTLLQILFVVLCMVIIRVTYYIVSRVFQRKRNMASFVAFSNKHTSTRELYSFISLPTNSANTRSGRLNVSIVLGSGGHTSEVLAITKSLPRTRFSSMTYFYATSDQGSRLRAEQQEKSIPVSPIESHSDVNYVSIPRAREVGQSYFTSIFTTLKAFIFVIRTVFNANPNLLIVNGPGSCVPVCAVVILFNLIGVLDCKIIFIESLTRVHRLSLSGYILYLFVDRFIVHWPDLAKKFILSEYLGILY